MQASASVVGSCLLDDFKFMYTDCTIPKAIIHKARTKLGVIISYPKAWMIKEDIVKMLKGDTVEWTS